MYTFFKKIRTYLREDDGAITVDWVVLTSAIVSFGFIATLIIRQQTAGVSGKIATYVDSQQISTVFTSEETAPE